MGIALFALSTFSQPFQGLAQWLRPHRSTAAPKASHGTLRAGSTLNKSVTWAVATGLAPHQRLFTPPNASGGAAGLASHQGAGMARFSEALAASRQTANTNCRSPRRPVRVFHGQSRVDAGRMVIAGRMADVCAELERMAAAEPQPR